MGFPTVVINSNKPFETPVFRLQYGATRTITLQIKDMYGNTYDFNGTETVTFVSYVTEDDTEAYLQTTGVVDAVADTVSFTFKAANINVAGWFYGQITISESGTPVHRMNTYLEVEAPLGDTSKFHPVTIEQVRNTLKDRSPSDNGFLDEQEFSDSQIAKAIFDVVEYWDTTTPAVNSSYNATTFPFKEIWMYGVLYELYKTAYLNLSRNRMATNAGGMTYDDKQRTDAYLQLYKMYEDEFKRMVMHKKREINLRAWSGTTGRFYRTT